MSDPAEQISIRETAQAVIRAIEDAGDNPGKLRQGILDATEQLRHRPDTGNSAPSAWPRAFPIWV